MRLFTPRLFVLFGSKGEDSKSGRVGVTHTDTGPHYKYLSDPSKRVYFARRREL